MASKKKQGRRKSRAPVTKAIIRAPDVLPAKARTRRQAALLVDGLVADINRLVRGADLQHEAVGSLLIEKLLHEEPVLAMGPESDLPPEYFLLRARAGRTLDLEQPELHRHLRVGALDRLLVATSGWQNLSWSKKLELLPLATQEDDYKRLYAGVVVANRNGVGVARLREYVQAAVPRVAGSVGRPRGPTLSSGKAMVRQGTQLAHEGARAALAAKVRELPEQQQRTFTKGLRETAENLKRLVDEIERGK